MRTTAELREGFLSFFEERGHLRVPSASLVPRADDQSTLLTTAGMQPQMPFFLGREPPPAPLTATSQKVLPHAGHRRGRARRPPPHVLRDARATSRSGSTSRRGRSSSRREFVQERMQLDWDRVWVTRARGRSAAEARPRRGRDRALAEGRHAARADRPAADRRRTSGRSAGRARAAPTRSCTATGARSTAAASPTARPAARAATRFLEFWNLVFMEYEQHADGTLTPLPDAEHRHRARARARRRDPPGRHARSTRRTATSRSWSWIAAESGVAYGDSPAATKAHRILADHGRGMTFLVGDGVTPSNEGRGYVLRRMIRRAVQQAQRIGLRDVHRISGVVVEQMGDAYPELREQADEIDARRPRRGGAVPRDARARAASCSRSSRRARRSRASRRSRSRRRTGSRSS